MRFKLSPRGPDKRGVGVRKTSYQALHSGKSRQNLTKLKVLN